MKSRTFFILVFIFLVSLGCFSCKTTATDDFSIDSEIAYCRSQAMRTLVSIPSLDKIPNSMDLDSIKWRYTQVGSWTCGFWPGILWYLYEDTKDNMWREAAGKVTDMIAPLAYTGHYRVYSQPQTSFWCCVGSGMENHARYGEMIYGHKDNNLYVNLFIPSTLRWGDTQIEQQTAFPDEEGSTLVISPEKGKKEFTLLFQNIFSPPTFLLVLFFLL